ncbi:MAG: hypothetical protein FJW95_13940 [Actinobacteria bacterium]|nr:hypothetical protein [Actinomycetota bacterium]
MTAFHLRGDDEHRHLPGTDRSWGESWYHDFAATDGSYGGWVRLGLYPNLGVAWYWLAIVRPGEPLVLISDTTAPCPERDAPLAVQTAGWRTAFECTEPLMAWRIRSSGRARTYANPADVFTPEHPGDGDLDVEIDLEWRGAAVVYPYTMTTRYEQAAWVQGDVSVAGTHVDVYCPGQRDHSWGNRVWSFPWLWSAGHLPTNRWFHGVRTLVPGTGPSLQVGYVVEPDHDLRAAEAVDVEVELDGDDLPTSAYLEIAGLETRVIPELHAPVLIASPDGVTSRFARSLCRFEAADGSVGRGWVELNLPVGADRVTSTRG